MLHGWRYGLALMAGLVASGVRGSEDQDVPVLPKVPALPAAQADNAGAPLVGSTPGAITASDRGGASACGQSCGPRYWGSAEYMLWWVRSTPLPPLVTTGDPAVAGGLPLGAFGTPGTVILSPSQQGFAGISGSRLTFGGWLSPDGPLGLEVSGFLTEMRSSRFAVNSNAAGSPVLAIPAIGTPPVFPTNTESAQLLSSPGLAAGGAAYTSSMRLWGLEGNGVLTSWTTDRLRVNLLVGVRYLELEERLQTIDSSMPLGTAVFAFQDHFGTRNQLFTGQLGARAEWTLGRYFVNMTGKIALGVNQETVDISGITAIGVPPGAAFPFPPPIAPVNIGGFFAQKSNIGDRTQSEFVAVPDFQLQIGMNLGDRVRLFAGYEFLYVSNVVRPGNQIDRTINGTQGFGGTLIGQARPAPLANTTDFWGNALTFGVRLSY
jgi:hypothetical protein